MGEQETVPVHIPNLTIQHFPKTAEGQALIASQRVFCLEGTLYQGYKGAIPDVSEKVLTDACAAGLPDGPRLADGGSGAEAYADAVATYLGMGVSRLADICNALCRWEVSKTQVRNLFGRQAIPMVWDFAEPNAFADSAGDFGVSLGNLAKVVDRSTGLTDGVIRQIDAARNGFDPTPITISTDPPYYDNIGYAILSDFFYVWLRRSLRTVWPGIFGTLLVPKAEELVATTDRDIEWARKFGVGTLTDMPIKNPKGAHVRASGPRAPRKGQRP